MGTCPRCQEPLAGDTAGICMRCTLVTSTAPAGAGSALVPAICAGDVIAGQWRVESKLGQGGMGTVLRAHDLQLDRVVAIKVLAEHLVTDEPSQQRFEREAKLTAKLDHPNVVAIHAVGRHAGRPYIVMKYLDGAPLKQWIGKLDAREVVEVFNQLCAGLGFIHSLGYVHRDIKPANVFRSARGHVTLLDFGILKEVSTGDTGTGLALGTLPYMAPEQLLAEPTVDHRADLFAATVMLYELLTGANPFSEAGRSLLDQVRARERFVKSLSSTAGITPGLCRLFQRGLATQAQSRFNSASELAEATHTALAGPLERSAPSKPSSPSGTETAAITQSTQPLPAELEALRAAATGSQQVPSRRPKRVGVLAAGAGMALVLMVGAGIRFLHAAKPTPVHVTEAAPALEPPVTQAVPPKPEAPLQNAEVVRTAPAPARVHHVAAPGRLQIVTLSHGLPYWASLSVDGKNHGTTPASLMLSPGSHAIRVERPGAKRLDQNVTIVSGKVATLRLELSP